jgi:hypothetical protein
MSGSRVLRLAILAGLTALALDLTVHARLTLAFDLLFVVLCVGLALAVRPRDFFTVAVLPPLLLLGLVVLVAVVHPLWVADPGDGLVQAVVSGLAHRASGLMTAYVLVLGVLAMRQHVRRKRAHQAGHSKRLGSPAPMRVSSGDPSEKSTTVVGSDPHSPESITASTT